MNSDPLTEALANVREGLVVRPGDTLVLTLPATMSAQRIDQFKAQLESVHSKLPEGAQVVCVAGPEQIAVVRAGTDQ